MPRFSNRQFGFTNGELSPRLHGRPDMQMYYAGLAICENWVPDHKGNLISRPGTVFASRSKDDQKPCLYPFNAGRNCGVVIEAYSDCFRFLINRAPVMDGDQRLELPHTYGADFCDLEYAEDCGALFIAHENHPKRVLRKEADGFALEDLNAFPFAPINSDEECKLCLGLSDNGQVELLLKGPKSPVGDDTPINVGDEIRISDAFVTQSISSIGFNVTVTATPAPQECIVTVPAGTGIGAYYLVEEFVSDNGDTRFKAIEPVSLCFVESEDAAASLTAMGCAPFTPEMVGQCIRLLDENGQSPGDNDDGTADPNTWLKLTVQSYVSPEEVVVNYDGLPVDCTDLFQLPAFADGRFSETVQVAQDRLWCAKDNCVSASRVGDFFDWQPTDPDGTVNPDNAIDTKISAGSCGDVRWFWPMGRQLLVGSSTGLHSLVGAGVNGAFAADGLAQQLNQNVGVSDMRPVQVGESVLFTDRTRTKLYGTGYTGQYDHVGLTEYTLFADHIGDCGIKKLAFQQCPFSVVWGITEQDDLFSLTVVPGQNVRGWARHRIGGNLIKNGCCDKPAVCDVVSVFGPGEREDDIAFVVQRTIDGEDRFYIEYLGDYFTPKSNNFESVALDSQIVLADTVGVGDASFEIDGSPSPIPSAAGAFAAYDGEDWFFYQENASGEIAAEAPNYTGNPVPGRDWVNRGIDEDCEWRQLSKPKYCEEPEFVDESHHTYRPPCGVQKIALCKENIGGADHLAGECGLVYSDGQMTEQTIGADGAIQGSGCLTTVGLPYDSTGKLLPYRMSLGATDGANDPSRAFSVGILIENGFWFEVGNGKRNDVMRVLEQWQRVDFPVEQLNRPQPFDGWADNGLINNLNPNDDSGVSFRRRGPWHSVIKNVETQIVASGGR